MTSLLLLFFTGFIGMISFFLFERENDAWGFTALVISFILGMMYLNSLATF